MFDAISELPLAGLARNPLAQAIADHGERYGLSPTQLVRGIGTVEQLLELMRSEDVPELDRRGVSFPRRMARRVGYTRQEYKVYVRTLTCRNVDADRQPDWIWKIEAPAFYYFGQAILDYLRKGDRRLETLLREIRGCAYRKRENKLKLLIRANVAIYTPSDRKINRFAQSVARHIGYDLTTTRAVQLELNRPFYTLITEFPPLCEEMRKREIAGFKPFAKFIAKGRDLDPEEIMEQCEELAKSLEPNGTRGLKPIVRIIESACGRSALKNTLFIRPAGPRQPAPTKHLVP